MQRLNRRHFSVDNIVVRVMWGMGEAYKVETRPGHWVTLSKDTAIPDFRNNMDIWADYYRSPHVYKRIA